MDATFLREQCFEVWVIVVHNDYVCDALVRRKRWEKDRKVKRVYFITRVG